MGTVMVFGALYAKGLGGKKHGHGHGNHGAKSVKARIIMFFLMFDHIFWGKRRNLETVRAPN